LSVIRNPIPKDWTYIAGKDDIAVSPIPDIADTHRVAFIHTSPFDTDEYVSNSRTGLGDDVFMLDRFIDYGGSTTQYARCVIW
jgi:hypothetical protein